MDKTTIDAEFAALAERLDAIEDVNDPKRVATTAEELHRLGYTPMLLVTPDHFIEADRGQIRAELERIRHLPGDELPTEADEADTVRIQAAKLLVSNYEILVRLRRPEADAWDEVIELYGED